MTNAEISSIHLDYSQTIQLVPQGKVYRKPMLGRYMIIAGLSTIVALKLYLLLFVLDPVVGVYGFLTSFIVFMAFFFAYTRYKDRSVLQVSRGLNVKYTEKRRLNNQYFLSVIVPAKNEPVIIRETVASFLASSYKRIEIILVNDGSTDETGNVMDALAREYPTKVKAVNLEKNLGKRKAIREGVAHCSPEMDILVCADSDCVVDTHALEKVVGLFDDPDVGAATAHARARNATQNILTKIQDAWYDGQFSIIKGMESAFDSVTCCSGTLSAFRKEAVMPCLDAWCNDKFLGVEFKPGDDRHLTAYVLGGNKHYLDKRSKIWKVRYCQSAIVQTEVPSSLRKLIMQQIRWKKSWIRMFLFTAPFYYKERSPIIGAFYYLQTGLSFLMPIVAFRALIFLPLQGYYIDALVYLSGLFFMGFLFGLEFKFRNRELGSRWLCRILMTIVSTFVLSFLMYYALLTIRKGSWLTR
jgi:hyaluronan synthase